MLKQIFMFLLWEVVFKGLSLVAKKSAKFFAKKGTKKLAKTGLKAILGVSGFGFIVNIFYSATSAATSAATYIIYFITLLVAFRIFISFLSDFRKNHYRKKRRN